VLPFTVGIRDSAVQLVFILGSVVTCGWAPYYDEKVTNRETKVWHFVIENGY
jgi:hypothetical protein